MKEFPEKVYKYKFVVAVRKSWVGGERVSFCVRKKSMVFFLAVEEEVGCEEKA